MGGGAVNVYVIKVSYSVAMVRWIFIAKYLCVIVYDLFVYKITSFLTIRFYSSSLL